MTAADQTATDQTAADQTATEQATADQPPAPVETPLRRNRDFLLLWLGSGLSALGSRASGIGYTLLVYWSTGSATAAGLVGFAALLPALVVQLPAGAWVDRWDRRRTMVWANLGRVVSIGSVAVTAALGVVSIPHLMVVAFVDTSLGAIYVLAERVAVFRVVPRSQLGTAIAANESRGRAASLAGQPLGTVLFGFLRWSPFGFAALAHLVALLSSLFVRGDLTAGERKPGRETLRSRIGEGFRFVWGQKYLRRALSLLTASNVLFQVLILGLIVIVKDNGGSPELVGLLLGANAVAGLLGSLCGNVALRWLGIRRVIMTVNVSWALLMPLIALTTNAWLLGLVYALIIFLAGVGNVAGMVYQVRTTPENMQARAASIATVITSGANSLGALAAGLLLDALSTTAAMAVVGAAMAVIALLAVVGFAGRAAAEAERTERAAFDLERKDPS